LITPQNPQGFYLTEALRVLISAAWIDINFAVFYFGILKRQKYMAPYTICARPGSAVIAEYGYASFFCLRSSLTRLALWVSRLRVLACRTLTLSLMPMIFLHSF
jgi:hypothetical protein